jgi:hypothetical protein
VSAVALWRDKDRGNRLGGSGLDVSSGGGAISWRLSRDLTLGASVFERDFDVSSVERGLSRDRETRRINLRYKGLRGSVVSVSYNNEEVQRTPTGTGELVPLVSDSDILRASIVSRLSGSTRLQVRYRSTETDHETFFDPVDPPDHFPSRLIGLPMDEDLLSGTLTHTLSPRTVLSGIYSKREQTHEVAVASLSVARQAEAETQTVGAQLVHNANSRARLSAAYYNQDGSTSMDATYGTSDWSADDIVFWPPIEGMAAFDYDATIATVSGSLKAGPRVRLFGRYGMTDTDGSQILYDLGDYLDGELDLDGVDLTYNPFDLEITDRWFGVGYMVDPRTEVTLSYQRRKWEDSANTAQNGSYDVVRLGIHGEF